MTSLAACFGTAGFADVATYINSGNVIFSGSAREAALEELLETEFGFELTTFLRTAEDLRAVAAATPFDLVEGDTHFVTFLKTAPKRAQAASVEALSGEFDTLVVDGRDVHWRMHGRSSDSLLVKRHWEKILGTNSSTSRNLTMIRKLLPKL